MSKRTRSKKSSKLNYYLGILVILLAVIVAGIIYFLYGTIKIEQAIVGTWVSENDDRYEVTFTKFGTVEERFDDLNTNGTWSVTRRIDLVDKGSDYQKQYGYFLKTNIEDNFLYSIESVDENSLELFYIPKGTTLLFKRKNNVQ